MKWQILAQIRLFLVNNEVVRGSKTQLTGLRRTTVQMDPDSRWQNVIKTSPRRRYSNLKRREKRRRLWKAEVYWGATVDPSLNKVFIIKPQHSNWTHHQFLSKDVVLANGDILLRKPSWVDHIVMLFTWTYWIEKASIPNIMNILGILWQQTARPWTEKLGVLLRWTAPINGGAAPSCLVFFHRYFSWALFLSSS